MHGWIVLLVLAHSTPGSYQLKSRGKITNKYLSKQFPDADWFKWCSYKGYTPGPFNLTVSKTTAPTAQLQTDALQTFWTHSDTTIGVGTIESGEEVAGAVATGLQKLRKSKKIVLDRANKVAKTFIKGAAILAPALGIISDIMGAIIGVQTPTAEDILKETNKAIAQLTEEVDNRLEEMKSYVDEKVISLEKDLNERKYTFLFAYWSGCVKYETNKETDLCQREAYRLIDASISEFCLFRGRLNAKNKFPETGTRNALSDDQRRRVEVNMISFRNYALLALFAMKTLEKTYDRERKQVDRRNVKKGGKSSLMTCKEMKDKKEEDRRFTPQRKQQKYCIYQNELKRKAAYFEAYGNAAIVEIQIVAGNRLKKAIFTDKEVYKKEETYTWWPSYSSGAFGKSMTFLERRVLCKAYVHQSMRYLGRNDKTEGKCGFDVMLVEDGYEPEDKNDNWYYYKPYQYTIIRSNVIGSSHPGDDSKTERWCHNLIREKQSEYAVLEQPAIKKYWSKEVLKVVTCGKLLTEGTVETCSDEVLKEHLSEAVDDDGSGDGASEKGKKYALVGCFKDTYDRAITGGFSTYNTNNVIEKCYTRALSQGNEYFAVQNNNQCYTSASAGVTYNYYGKSGGCVNGKGGSWRLSVYKTVVNKWRDDWRCGVNFTLPNGEKSECNPHSESPCCSNKGYCGKTRAHCNCRGCIDYRRKYTDLRCKGIDDGCCTEDNPCVLGDGDCDDHDECAGALVCGNDNCAWGDGDDCCIKG